MRANARVDGGAVDWRRAREGAEMVVRRALEGGDAARALRKTLRKGYDEAERRAIARAALGTEVWRIRLARERVECERAATVETRDALERAGDDAGVLLFVYWLRDRGGAGQRPSEEVMREMYGAGADACRAVTEEGVVAWSSGAAGVSERAAIPFELAQLFVDDYGEAEALDLARAMNEPGPVTCRANVAKATVDEIIARLEREGAVTGPTKHGLAKYAFDFPNGPPPNGGIFGSQSWLAGYYEVMDQGSQLIAEALEPRAGERILDACAGNGGKTLAMAAMMSDTGSISAFDVDRRRLAHLSANAARAGVADRVTLVEHASLGDIEPRSFDAVLVDAPCSSVGALRRTPSLRHSHDDPHQLAEVQTAILRDVAPLVRPGGRLVYATCSVLSIENHAVSRAFESAFAEDFEPWPFDAPLPISSRRLDRPHERSLSPHVHGTDGFFIARFRRKLR